MRGLAWGAIGPGGNGELFMLTGLMLAWYRDREWRWNIYQYESAADAGAMTFTEAAESKGLEVFGPMEFDVPPPTGPAGAVTDLMHCGLYALHREYAYKIPWISELTAGAFDNMNALKQWMEWGPRGRFELPLDFRSDLGSVRYP